MILKELLKRIPIKVKSQNKSSIVSRLLRDGFISTDEAEILLDNTNIVLHIEKLELEMSSGAKIVSGDDNEVNY